MLELHKANSKKGMIANICANIIATRKQKDYQQYIDTAAAVHMTYDLCLYINADLDLIQKQFKTLDGYKIQIQSTGIIILEMLLDGESIYIHLHNVNY